MWTQTVLKQKNKVELTLPDFKVDYKATIIQTVVLAYWLTVKSERLSEATLCTALEATKRRLGSLQREASERFKQGNHMI